MQAVQEAGAVFFSSINLRKSFADISQASEITSMRKIKPLCPTRWLVRVPAIKNILDQYENVLQSLEEMGASSGTMSARANGG